MKNIRVPANGNGRLAAKTYGPGVGKCIHWGEVKSTFRAPSRGKVLEVRTCNNTMVPVDFQLSAGCQRCKRTKSIKSGNRWYVTDPFRLKENKKSRFWLRIQKWEPVNDEFIGTYLKMASFRKLYLLSENNTWCFSLTVQIHIYFPAYLKWQECWIALLAVLLRQTVTGQRYSCV